jgi:hypothetical protein
MKIFLLLFFQFFIFYHDFKSHLLMQKLEDIAHDNQNGVWNCFENGLDFLGAAYFVFDGSRVIELFENVIRY